MPTDIYGRQLGDDYDLKTQIQEEAKKRGTSRVTWNGGPVYEKTYEDKIRDRKNEANMLINTYDETRWKRDDEEGTPNFMSRIDEKGYADEKDIWEFNRKGKRKVQEAKVDDLGDLQITYQDGSTKTITKEMREAFGKIRQKYGTRDEGREYAEKKDKEITTERAKYDIEKWKEQQKYLDEKTKIREEKAAALKEKQSIIKIKNAQGEPWDDTKHSAESGYQKVFTAINEVPYAVKTDKASNIEKTIKKTRDDHIKLRRKLMDRITTTEQEMQASGSMYEQAKKNIADANLQLPAAQSNLEAIYQKFVDKGIPDAEIRMKKEYREAYNEVRDLEIKSKDTPETYQRRFLELQGELKALKTIKKQQTYDNYQDMSDKYEEAIRYNVPGAEKQFEQYKKRFASKTSQKKPFVATDPQQAAELPEETWVTINIKNPNNGEFVPITTKVNKVTSQAEYDNLKKGDVYFTKINDEWVAKRKSK